MKHPAVIAVIAAMLGLLANSLVVVIGNIFAAQIEERRDRREVVLELLRANDSLLMERKLAILNSTGLLPDPDGKLRRAVRENGIKQLVVACAKTMPIPSDPAKVKPDLTGDARIDVVTLANTAVQLRLYSNAFKAIIDRCAE